MPLRFCYEHKKLKYREYSGETTRKRNEYDEPVSLEINLLMHYYYCNLNSSYLIFTIPEGNNGMFTISNKGLVYIYLL